MAIGMSNRDSLVCESTFPRFWAGRQERWVFGFGIATLSSASDTMGSRADR
jgi:hypothetical protein